MMAHQISQFNSIWKAANKQYTEVTGKALDNASFPHPGSTDNLINFIELHNKDFRHFKTKKATLFTVLRNVCKPIETIGNLAAGGVSTVFPPSTVCFGAISYLIKAADGVSESYEAIINLLETLKVSGLGSDLIKKYWCKVFL